MAELTGDVERVRQIGRRVLAGLIDGSLKPIATCWEPTDDYLQGLDEGWDYGAERMRDVCADKVGEFLTLFGGISKNNIAVLVAAVRTIPLPGSDEERTKTTIDIPEGGG